MADIKEVEQQIANDEEGAVVPIFQKNGDPYLAADGSQASVTVVGSESKRYRLARDNATRKMMRRRMSKLEPDDLRKLRVEQASAGVIAWHGWEKDGKPFPCEPASVELLCRADHILEQIEEGIQKHADFFGKPSPS